MSTKSEFVEYLRQYLANSKKYVLEGTDHIRIVQGELDNEVLNWTTKYPII